MFELVKGAVCGELSFGVPYELEPGVPVTVTDVRVEAQAVPDGSRKLRLILEVAARNETDESYEFVNEFGLLNARGTFCRHVWMDPAEWPSAFSGVRSLKAGEAISGQVYVPVELDSEMESIFTPALGALWESGCSGCGRDEHVFVAKAIWQPVSLVSPRPTLSA